MIARLKITISAVFLLFFAQVFQAGSFRIHQKCDSNELSKPPSRRSYRNSSDKSQRHAAGLLAQSNTADSIPLHQQYVEDDIVFYDFEPLNASSTAPSQNDPARQEVPSYFREVDCSPTEATNSVASALTIPYDEMQLAFFQGDEVVDVVLKNTQDVINVACEQIMQFHKSRVYIDMGKDSERNSANAMRSIKSLIYWMGGRILNCAKRAMNRLDQNTEADPTDNDVIGRNLEKRIRSFVNELVNHWQGIIQPTEHQYLQSTFKRPKEGSSPEKYVCNLWDYLNSTVFNNSLPEFADMKFSWYNMIEKDGNVLPTFKGELFRYLRKDVVAFPGLAYPKELSRHESALGNCVFRSMVKLYCDIFGPSFGSEDYADTVVSAFQFIESEEAIVNRINFSCIQRNVMSQMPELRSLQPSMNAYDEFDTGVIAIKDPSDLFSTIYEVPYFKNPYPFSQLKEVVKDTETALEIFDRSFRNQSEIQLKEVMSEINSGAVELDLDDAIIPIKDKLSSDARRKGEGTKVVGLETGGIANLWKRTSDGDLTIPENELQRALLYGDLEKFGNIMSLGVNDLVELQPVQLNRVQNRVVSLCNNALNQVRAVDTYILNFSLTPEDHSKDVITQRVQTINVGATQCIIFLHKLMNRCLNHNGLFPLDNSFLRTRPLELLLQDANKLRDDTSNTDVMQFGCEAIKKEQEMKPVPFPQEYINDAVSADDPVALKFLLNFYNYNLFGGRLPIDIEIKFEEGAIDEYLSSHDDSSDVLKVPSIYLNPLVKTSKPLIARLLLEECFKLYLRWHYRYKSSLDGKPDSTITEILDSDIASKIRRHICNCIEGSGDWPFFFDEHYYMAPYENERVSFLKERNIPLRGRKLGQIFKDLIKTDVDVVSTLTGLVERTMMTELWEKKILPIRMFINAIQGGDYDIMYTIMVNSSSIKTTCDMPINTINHIENKFKEACQVSHELDCKRGETIGEDGIKMNTLVNIEAIKCVECAFDELREHATKHHLISSDDLTVGITEATNDLARCQPEEVDHTKSDVQCSLINVNSVGIHTPVSTDNKDEQLVNKYMQEDATKDRVETDDEKYQVNEEERVVLAEAIYRAYNDRFFNNSLPQNIKIVFVDGLDDLSALEDDMHTMSPPTIKLSTLHSNAKLIFLQMMLQMVNISFLYSTHNVEMDCLRYFGVAYRSAFQQFHTNQQQYIRSKLLPISHEARMKAKGSAMNKGSENYIKSLKEAAMVDTGKSENKSLLDMEIDEFIDEVLDGREKANVSQRDASLCNPFEEYQALKSFAKHFVNWRRTKRSFQDVATIKSPIPKGNERTLQFVNNHIICTLWSRFKFEHIERLLKDMNIEMPLSRPLGLNWQPVINEEQQFKIIKYLTLESGDEDNIFTILTKSGACNPKEAYEVLIKLSDPYLKLDPYPEEQSPKSDGEEHIEEVREHIESQGDNDPTFGNEVFANELQSLMSDMDLDTAETVNLLVDKLMRRNYSDAMGILNSHPKRSFLKDRVIKFLDVIRNNGVIKDRHHIEILEFLRN
ncbi:hypothetical protein BgAZ_208820 [Babesia gibsoni]|uniref:Uncharacterized protein n=1 Tax=Babesia gibsoni TaxID=33632 RepID=A0AAD8PER3_BABGI|nr:hypothetical protein BgAZ_208820 [Babesia gibsoni]